MPRSKKPELRFPIKLTLAQRKFVAAVVLTFADRLKLDEPNQRIMHGLPLPDERKQSRGGAGCKAVALVPALPAKAVLELAD
jgi:hypothetical protein